MKQCVLFIIGPTASGKTALSEIIYNKFGSAEIINCDMGQLYAPLKVGTAKPNLQCYPYKTHLFDELNTPEYYDACQYADRAHSTVEAICKRNNLPIFVGGTIFYVKSLFFALSESCKKPIDVKISNDYGSTAWNHLHALDPDRAQSLHPHDLYRINRALHIIKTTGEKPSTLKPHYQTKLNPLFIYIQPDRQILKDRINQRTELMIHQEGWIDEAAKLIGTPWELFVQKKGLIGYANLIAWIKQGRPKEELPLVITTIQKATWRYAKRQIAFWRRFCEEYVDHVKNPSIIHVQDSSENSIKQIMEAWEKHSQTVNTK